VQLDQLIPSIEIFRAMSVEDFGHVLLKVAKSQLQNGTFWPDGIVQVDGRGYKRAPFPGHEREVERVLAEAWNWLSTNSLIVPAPGLNGANGFRMLSARGGALADQANVDSFRQAV
jgi:hypothetical protein